MKNFIIAVAVIFGVVTLSLVVGGIWSTGLLQERLFETAIVTFIIALGFGVAATES